MSRLHAVSPSTPSRPALAARLLAGAGAAISAAAPALGQGCPIPPTNISYFIGVNDNYQPVPEPLTVRPVVASWAPGNAPPLVNLDVNASDRARIHSFRRLPDNIVGATLTIRMRGVSGLCCNDSIHLGFNSGSGTWVWNSRIGMNNCGGPPVPGLTPVWTTGSDQTFTLNLAALPTGTGGVVNLLPFICEFRNNLDLYVQDDTDIDYIRLDIQACCTQSVTSIRNAGKCDSYSGLPEPAWRKPAFNSWLTTLGPPIRQFDTPGCDMTFGHTFTNLPRGIIDAQLRICMKPFCGLASNDGLAFEFLGLNNSPPNTFAFGTVINGSGAITPNTNPWSPPNPGGCYSVNLTALNLLGYMADRDFDVYIQDDTGVDCMQLVLQSCSRCARHPVVAWTGTTAVLLDEATGAVLDPAFIRGAPLGMRRPMETLQVGQELWVSDQLADAIFRFDADGLPVGVVRGGLDDPRGMEFARGIVYVANKGTDNGAPGDAVVMISPDGVVLGDFPAENPWDVYEWRGELLVSNIQQEDIDRYDYDGRFIAHLVDSDGQSGIDFPTQLRAKTSEAELTLRAGGFSPPAGIYDYDADGRQTGYIDVGSEVRGVFDTEDGGLLYATDSGVFLRDAGGATTQLASGAARWLSQIGDPDSVTPAPFCLADCDTSTGAGTLDVFDFLCFQNAFAANEPNACQCDTSTGQDLCDLFDFLCFQNAFAAGCPNP